MQQLSAVHKAWGKKGLACLTRYIHVTIACVTVVGYLTIVEVDRGLQLLCLLPGVCCSSKLCRGVQSTPAWTACSTSLPGDLIVGCPPVQFSELQLMHNASCQDLRHLHCLSTLLRVLLQKLQALVLPVGESCAVSACVFCMGSAELQRAFRFW